MKNYYLIVIPMYLLSISFSISSNSWMAIWIGMEMNLLTFIFIMMEHQTFNSTESSMKYFIIQSIGSLIFLFAISMNMQMIYIYQTFSINDLIPPLALMLKSGMAPLHTWTPDISMKLSPLSLFLFLSVQKIIPMLIIFSSWTNMIKWIIPINITIGAIAGISQASAQKLLLFSSINNTGWMLMSLTHSFMLFTMFFTIYSIMNSLFINFLNTQKIKWISQIKTKSLPEKFLISTLMMSLSGLPPFMGFIPKWLILKMISPNLTLVSLISIIMSVVTMFFYLKISLYSLLSSSFTQKWNMIISNFHLNMFFILNISSFLMFIFLT